MIVDVRCYTITPRKMKVYLETFEKYALPVQKRAGMNLLGYFVHSVGSLNKVTHLWVSTAWLTWNSCEQNAMQTQLGRNT